MKPIVREWDVEEPEDIVISSCGHTKEEAYLKAVKELEQILGCPICDISRQISGAGPLYCCEISITKRK